MGEIAVVHERKVIKSDVTDHALVEVRVAFCVLECCIATIAGSVDAHAVGIRDLLLHSPIDAIREIVLHLAGPLPVACVLELHAIPAGAPVVHLQHRVATAGEELHLRVPMPVIPDAMWAAVGIDDQRQVLAIRA